MTDANLQENNTLHLLGLTIYIDMKWDYYIESTASFTARKFDSLYRARFFSHQNPHYTFINIVFPRT